MTGETLHTKYRPATLDEVVGQDHIQKGLSAVLAAGKQQAFIFEGPSGTGKTTLARICAKALGCLNPTEIDAATHTGVDAMREVAEGARFVSLDGGAKAYIVDECHRLTKQAWESLLKDIEEPPAGVYWFFCTTEGTKIPATIQTRCVTFSLREVAWRKLIDLVARTARAEGLDVPDEVLDVCAEEAGGSPRRALVNLTTVAHCKTAADAQSALNRIGGAKEAIDLARMICKKGWTPANAMAVVKSMADDKVTSESIRHVVRAYATQMVMGNPGDIYACFVLGQFVERCDDANQLSDIVLRVARCAAFQAKN